MFSVDLYLVIGIFKGINCNGYSLILSFNPNGIYMWLILTIDDWFLLRCKNKIDNLVFKIYLDSFHAFKLLNNVSWK